VGGNSEQTAIGVGGTRTNRGFGSRGVVQVRDEATRGGGVGVSGGLFTSSGLCYCSEVPVWREGGGDHDRGVGGGGLRVRGRRGVGGEYFEGGHAQ